MSTINSISNEVLWMIFEHVHDIAHVAQCRLVCKRWDQLAASEMLTRKITLKSNEQAQAFYAHVSRDPSKCRLIMQLHFDPSYKQKSMKIMAPLLRLVFTPNMKRITGNMEDPILKLITDIANKSEKKYDLLMLGNYFQRYSFALANALIAFNASLCVVSLINTLTTREKQEVLALADRLDEFPQLSTFYFVGNQYSMSELERLLHGCTRLKELRLRVWNYTTTDDHRAWMEANVEKMHTLEKLTLSVTSNADLVDHIVYKYPNVKEIELIAFGGSTAIEVFNANVSRMVDAIQHIQRKTVILKISLKMNPVEITRYWNSRNYKVEIIQPILERGEVLPLHLLPM